MTVVYQLIHFNIQAEDDELDVVDSEDDKDRKLIGFYSSQEKAEATLEELRQKPGFRDWPGGFRILHATLDAETSWANGFFASEEEEDDVTSPQRRASGTGVP